MFLQRRASQEQFADFMRQRSIYHLKESDPQSFVLARIDGPAKAALAEVQSDEYGAGAPDRLHAALFARALDALGFACTSGAYTAGARARPHAVHTSLSMCPPHPPPARAPPGPP